jgi:hypothetical protein
MPDDMAYAAQASPDFIACGATSVGEKIEQTVRDKQKRSESDPLLNPESYLIEVKRENQDGQYKVSWDVRWTVDGNMKDFSMPEGLMGAAEELATDLKEPQVPEDAELEDRAVALAQLDDDQIEDYLDISDHTFCVEDDEESSGSEESDDSEDSQEDRFSEEGPQMDEEQSKKIQEMKNKMQGE